MQRELVRGDWFSDFDIGLAIKEIRRTKRSIFRRLSKQKCEAAAFAALIFGEKGKYIKYASSLEMADFLCPNSQLNVQDQKDNFQIRSIMNPLP